MREVRSASPAQAEPVTTEVPLVFPVVTHSGKNGNMQFIGAETRFL